VSKSEALRRAIRAAAAQEGKREKPALKTLDALQKSLALSPTRAKRWAEAVRAERHARSPRGDSGAND
jgi:Arc/MetJ-type ribon-helix-helix transcriptional regulator